jgi:hypothetical protein
MTATLRSLLMMCLLMKEEFRRRGARRVSDHHLGARGPQGGRPLVLAADHGADWKPAFEEQAGHGAPDRPELTGCPGYEDRSVIGHATSLPFVELVFVRLEKSASRTMR